MTRPWTDQPAAAVAAALSPYAWREFTERMLVRRVVGALDQQEVIGFLEGVPGTDVGVVEAVEPAEDADERLDVVMSALDGHIWREWSLTRLCAHLIAAVDAWYSERESLESDLRRLLDDH